ncbi:glycerate kinase [Nesterenkonia sandarakina]|uniref:Glycerate kinase n=1 Tax=Nesterenkonia sandarakina TaxID=272918 RepID=A0A2T0YN76_9MICC|nr:glycerate kinase [Nesterenkonia sandarakina]PRZ16787.1 glycerate kinase [Nesterenkonia sandarakina]
MADPDVLSTPAAAVQRIVCVPDSFKGSVTAAEAAAAMARGARQVFGAAEIVELPFADGGEGTLEALLAAWGRSAETLEVSDALGRPVTAHYGRSADGRTGVIEAAQGNGLPQVSDVALRPLRADTFGVGLIARTLLDDPDCAEILLCIGGSASTDGGTGLLRALGAEFLDPAGEPVAPGGGGLSQISAVDLTGLHPRARAVDWRIAVDVDNPLTGERGAAAVFGPQKGATPEEIDLLDDGLAHLAQMLAGHSGTDPRELRETPGFGAAGGMPLALSVLLGAQVLPGSQMVAEALDLQGTLAQADLVITGEGSLDTQSLGGKVVQAVRRGAPFETPVLVIAGGVRLSAEQCRAAGLTAAFSIAPGAASLQDLLTRAPELIEDTTAQACGLLRHSMS